MWKWYDRMKEPWRMLTALALVSPSFVLLNMSQPWNYIGAVWLVTICMTRMAR